MSPSIASLGELVDDPQVRLLLRHWGDAYHWGHGDPGTLLADHDEWDCSGFAQACLVALGQLSCTEPDRCAYDLAMICDPVPDGSEQLGDLAFYGSPVHHVMVCLGPGIVLGASGGNSKTRGGNCNAYVQLRRTCYRRDLRVIGRLKSEES